MIVAAGGGQILNIEISNDIDFSMRYSVISKNVDTHSYDITDCLAIILGEFYSSAVRFISPPTIPSDSAGVRPFHLVDTAAAPAKLHSSIWERTRGPRRDGGNRR